MPIIVLLVFSTVAASAQQPAPNQPIELPEIIVQGKSRVDIPGGAKIAPARPPLLSAALLDSLNPIEKIPLPGLPESAWPIYQQPFTTWPGWLSAQIGNYLTPQVAGGYSLGVGGYVLDLNGAVEHSNGWLPNADYTSIDLGAMSSYVAPEQFIFFGGSTTVVDANLRHRQYRLFAVDSAPSRSTTAIRAGVATDGEYEDLQYQGRLLWSTQSLTTDLRPSVSDNHLEGWAEVLQHFTSFDLGASADVRLRGFADRSYPYTALLARAAYESDHLMASARVGPQWATATGGDSRFGLSVLAEVDVFASPDFTLEAHAGTGLRPLSVGDMLAENPYLSDSAVIDVPYDVFAVGGSLLWHPSTRLTASVGIDLRRTDRDLVWIAASPGLFEPTYRSTTVMQIGADVRWLISSADVLVADLLMTNATVDDAESQTYLPSVRAALTYERSWSDAFRTQATIVYVGDRFADLTNAVVLSGFIDLRLQASYSISQRLDITAQARNLLGSTMVIWDGYRERGIFITGGILWKF